MDIPCVFECPVLVRLLMAGVWFPARLKFYPLLHLKEVFRRTIGGFSAPKGEQKKGVSAFEAAATSLAGTMGTGNIVGVAAALAAGGPGAVLWMVIGALFGMAVKYAEIVLGILYRRRNSGGEFRGGPMYYMEDGLKWKHMAKAFALLCAVSAVGTGNLTQVNAAAGAIHAAFPLPVWLVGLVMALFCLAVSNGGMKRVGKVMGIVMPVISVGYLAGCLWVIVCCYRDIPMVLAEIWRSAFGIRPAASGLLGLTLMRAMRYGLARGVFSHEAGMGSAPIAHGGADCKTPQEQGLWGMLEVFWDTVIGCTTTALVLLLAAPEGLFGGLEDVEWTSEAFSRWFGTGGEWFVSLSLAVFAAAALVSWWVYGSQAVEYLAGSDREKNQRWQRRYLIFYLVGTVAGSMVKMSLVWKISDLLNCCMILPNLAALVLLSGQIKNPPAPQKKRREKLLGFRRQY